MKSPALLNAWNRTVRRAPEAIAVIEAGTGRVTHRGELDALAAAWRDEHGVGLRGRIVVFAEPNGREWFRLFLGLLQSGAVIAALDPGEPLEAQRATALAIHASFLWNGKQLEKMASGRVHRDGRRLIKLTSGSTGAPCGLAFTDAQMLADGRQVCAAMSITSEDINLAVIPLGHSYGLGNLVVPLLAQGTAVVCASAPLPHAIAADVVRWKPTVFPAVPALIGALAGADVPAEALQSLRLVISAGAMLPAEIAQRFHDRFDLNVHNFYGSSETGGIAFDRNGEAALSGRSVGTPLPGVRLRFGRAQRFTIESQAVFTLGNRRGGTHRPADLGELNPAGELMLLGRVKSFVKIAGRRLNLAEIERALRNLPGVHDAFVVQHPDRPEQLIAAVASARAADELRGELRARLAAWKIPRRLVILDEFPRTQRGKSDTRRLLEVLNSPAKNVQPTKVASISILSAARQISA